MKELLLTAALLVSSCGNDDDSNKKNNNQQPDTGNAEQEETLTADDIPDLNITGDLGTPITPKVHFPCKKDVLSAKQALVRAEWAYKCNYISKRERDYYIFEDSKDFRKIPFYPSFYIKGETNEGVFNAPKAEEEATQCFTNEIKKSESVICTLE